MDHHTIKRLEEISMNAWPSLQTVVYDGWLLRFADGFTKRANSVNPIYDSRITVYDKIKYCEAMYRSKSLKTIFKLTRAVYPEDLDAVLSSLGYRKEAVTSVQVCETLPRCVDDEDMYEYSESLTDDWLGLYVQFNNIAIYYKQTISAMLGNIGNKRCFVLLRDSGAALACGLGVLEHDWIGLFDIAVSPEYRNKGYGQRLVSYLLNWGAVNGAVNSYLQVVADNTPALRLYEKTGFKELYRYWYRIRNGNDER
jgi:ribosomal protein S18 acetylase RimI-like enzyme